MKVTFYIFTKLLLTTLLITGVITIAVWLVELLKIIEFVIPRANSLMTLFNLSFLVLPDILTITLPLTLFVAVIFTYNKLIMESEIVVLRATGVSNWALAKPVLLLGICFTLLLYILTIKVLPQNFQLFKQMEFQLRNTYSTSFVQEGVFNTYKNITIRVEERFRDGSLRGIFAVIKNPDKPSYSIIAEEGLLIQTPKGPSIVLVNGNRQEEDKNGNISTLFFDRTIINLNESINAPEIRHRKLYEYSLKELLFPDSSLTDPTLKQRLKAEGHKRLLTPLYALTFAIIGVAFMLLSHFNRRGYLLRITYAVASIIVIQGLGLMFMNLSSRYQSALLGAYGFICLPLLTTLFILKKKGDTSLRNFNKARNSL